MIKKIIKVTLLLLIASGSSGVLGGFGEYNPNIRAGAYEERIKKVFSNYPDLEKKVKSSKEYKEAMKEKDPRVSAEKIARLAEFEQLAKTKKSPSGTQIGHQESRTERLRQAVKETYTKAKGYVTGAYEKAKGYVQGKSPKEKSKVKEPKVKQKR